MEFTILESGIRVKEKSPRLCFRLQAEQGERWRVVALRELLYLTKQDRDREDILGRQWAAVRGLYSAGVNFTFAAGALFKPRHVGVVQWYGSVGEAATEAEATDEALCGLEAVQGLLANYPQSRTGDPKAERLQWYLDFVRNAPRVLVVLGHPDPRMSREGEGQDGAAGASDDDLAQEQTEMFLRALVARRKQFVFHVTADYISRHRLADGLVTVARVCSDVASRRRGSIGMGVSVAIPFMAAASQAWTGSRTGGRSVGRSAVDALSESLGQAHTEGEAHTDSYSHSVSDGESWGTADTVGSFSSTSVSKTTGTANTQGSAHTEGTAHTNGSFSSSGVSGGASWGWSHTDGSGTGWNSSFGEFQSVGDTSSWSEMVGGALATGHTEGTGSADSKGTSDGWVARGEVAVELSKKVDISGGGSYHHDWSSQHTDSKMTQDSEVKTDSWSKTTGGAHTEQHGTSKQWGISGNSSTSDATSGGGFSSWSSSGGSSSSTTRSAADTVSNADTVSQGTTTSKVSGSSSSHTNSHSTSHVESDTWGAADTKSQADTHSHALGRSHADGVGTSEMAGRSGGEVFGGTVSRGIVPGVNLSRSWMTEDDVADRVTEVLRGLERVLDAASAEGGFMTQAAIFVEDGQAEKLAAAAVGQAYYGLNTPTPVCAMPVPDEDADDVRQHALACRPCLAVDGDPFGGMLWSKYSTLLTAGMLSAYTRPAWFEEGVATTVQEAEPPFAFYPDLTGEVFMGHQFSFETGELTQAPLLISRDKMFHAMFAADTGFGKSVAAMRLAYETTKKWKFRTLVLEFSTGWRALVNAPGLEGHFQIYQLSPGGSFPMRWNPLEIGRHIDPETQWRAFCDVFGGVARMGVKRQIHDFRRVLKRVYVAAGVLVRDLDVIEDPQWGCVQADEADLIGTPAGTSIKELSPTALQMIAVHRSKQVGLEDLYAEVQEELSRLPPSDRVGRPIMEGIAARLEPLIYGAVGRMFGKGEGSVAVSDLAQPWGLCVIEGGDHLDEFSKLFLLTWFGWHAYQDAFRRHARGLADPGETVQIFGEELNKIVNGGQGGGEEDDGQGSNYLVTQLSQMWLDSRKANAWLHAITQVPSLIPRPIRQSCATTFFGNEQGADDRDIEVGVLARSEKGFTDEAYRRWLARLPYGQMVVKMGYAGDQRQLEPMKIRPAMLSLPVPSDEVLETLLNGQAVRANLTL
ncbi:MAG: serine-rich protein [Anaerolineae bacterium]|nr:serine-rich protein [Anaerolineae bacterium]